MGNGSFECLSHAPVQSSDTGLEDQLLEVL